MDLKYIIAFEGDRCKGSQLFDVYISDRYMDELQEIEKARETR